MCSTSCIPEAQLRNWALDDLRRASVESGLHCLAATLCVNTGCAGSDKHKIFCRAYLTESACSCRRLRSMEYMPSHAIVR